MNPNNATQQDECHGRHGHHAVVCVAEVVEAIGDDLEAQKAAAAQKLAQAAHNHKDQGVTQAIANTVEE